MGLINLGTNYKEAIEKARKRDEALAKDSDRFHYPKTNDADQLKNLLPISLDGISFPVSNLSTEMNQAIVEHKYPNRDSARLESLGREPMVFHMTGVFVNTITPGPGEKWKKGQLFPQTYAIVQYLALKKQTIKFTHPILGEIFCKITSFSSDLEAKFRGGATAQITLKETINDKFGNNNNDLFKSIAKQNAKALDTIMYTLKPSPSELGIPEYKKGLLDLVNDIQTMIAAPGKFAGQIAGTIDSLEGRVHLIINRIENTYTTAWGQANQLAYKLKADAQDLRKLAGLNESGGNISNNEVINQTTNNNQPQICVYITEKKTVFTNLTTKLNNTYNQLIILNPMLASKASIPVNTKVRYYSVR